MKLKHNPSRLHAPKPVDAGGKSASWRVDRSSSSARGYTYEWQCERAEFLRCNPFCVMCRKRGRFAVATVVDHVKPHNGDMVIFWDRSNWQSLCATCHNKHKQRLERDTSKRAKPAIRTPQAMQTRAGDATTPVCKVSELDAGRVGGLKVQPGGDT